MPEVLLPYGLPEWDTILHAACSLSVPSTITHWNSAISICVPNIESCFSSTRVIFIVFLFPVYTHAIWCLHPFPSFPDVFCSFCRDQKEKNLQSMYHPTYKHLFKLCGIFSPNFSFVHPRYQLWSKDIAIPSFFGVFCKKPPKYGRISLPLRLFRFKTR